MNKMLNDLLPYLDHSSFSYNPTVGSEKTSLDLYYIHKIRVGSISVDNGNKLYLSIFTYFTESIGDSFPRYYADLDRFLHRFKLKPVLRFATEGDITYQQVCEILSINQILITYVDVLSACLNSRTTISVPTYVDTVRRIVHEFG